MNAATAAAVAGTGTAAVTTVVAAAVGLSATPR